jgi:hypothetical protein
MAVFSGGSLMSQPPPPAVQIAPSNSRTNLVLTTTARPGYYYTMQSSSNLSDWTSLNSVYATGEILSWTNAISTPSGTQFFRAKADLPNTAVITTYNDWTNAILLSNGLVQAFIVPSAGRVMQFCFAGTNDGPFWVNSVMVGQTSTANNWNTTGAFGGDKAWPSPQTTWADGGWPPPTGFDGEPYTYGFTNGVVTITSPVDSSYGIQCTRTIQLLFDEPVHRVSSTFGNPVGIWTITQVSDPVGIYVPVPLPSNSIFAPTNWLQRESPATMPPNFTDANGLVSFTRNTTSQCEMGFEAGSLAWVGATWSMRIDGPRVAGLTKTNYPNSGCSTSVYTNPDPVPYCELEFFSPWTNLMVGQSMAFVTTYNLFNRTESDPTAEALKILGLPAQ